MVCENYKVLFHLGPVLASQLQFSVEVQIFSLAARQLLGLPHATLKVAFFENLPVAYMQQADFQ